MKKIVYVLIALLTISVLFGILGCAQSTPAPALAPAPAKPSTAAPASSAAAQVSQVKFRWKYQSSEDVKMTAGAIDKFFCDEVTKRSNGQLTIDQYPNNGLNIQSGKLVQGLNDKLLEGAFILGVWAAGSVPVSTAFSLPGVLPKDAAKMDKALQAVRPYLEKAFLDKGVVLGGLGFSPAGRKLFTKKPVNTVADIKGLKIRGGSPDEDAMNQGLGAVPTPVDWTEIYTALDRGVVDGYTSAITALMASKTYELCKYCYDTNHSPSMFIGGISKPAYDELPADLQKLVKQVGQEAFSRHQVDQPKNEAVQLEMLIKDKQSKYTPASDEVLSLIRKSGLEFATQWSQKAGAPAPEMLAAINKAIQ